MSGGLRDCAHECARSEVCQRRQRVETYTVHRVRACGTSLPRVHRNPPLGDVLQRPAERSGFILPTALQARRFPAYRSGKALPATTPLRATQSQHTAENYTKLNQMQRTTQRE
jgi:hypothetical protein